MMSAITPGYKSGREAIKDTGASSSKGEGADVEKDREARKKAKAEADQAKSAEEKALITTKSQLKVWGGSFQKGHGLLVINTSRSGAGPHRY
jgi:hypothetical protein